MKLLFFKVTKFQQIERSQAQGLSVGEVLEVAFSSLVTVFCFLFFAMIFVTIFMDVDQEQELLLMHSTGTLLKKLFVPLKEVHLETMKLQRTGKHGDISCGYDGI